MPSIGPISAPTIPALWAGSTDPRAFAGTYKAPPANYAFLNAFTVTSPITVSTVSLGIGVQSGNIDLGIYDSIGNVLTHTGSTACPAAPNATIALLTTITLVPGVVYYSAFSADNGTVTVPGTSVAAQVAIKVNGVSRYLNTHTPAAFPLAGLGMPGTNSTWVFGIVFS